MGRMALWPVFCILAATLATAQDSLPDEEPEVLSLSGTIIAVAKDPKEESGAGEDDSRPRVPAFEMKVKGKTISVVPAAAVRFLQHKIVPLPKVEDATTVYVLGRKQESTRVPETSHKLPPQIVNIVTVVVAKAAWKPPPLTPELKKRKVAWIKGRLYHQGPKTLLDYINMQIGKDRKVVQVDAPAVPNLKKKQRVQVRGKLDAGKKPKELLAAEITLLEHRMNPKEYRHILGD